MFRKLSLILALVMMLSIFSCMNVAMAEGQTLVVGVPTLLNSLDFEEPTLSGGQIISLMRDKGLRWVEQAYPYDDELAAQNVYYPDFTATEGRLIESFEVDPDAQHAVFHLRKGVTSQWGNELTTEDVRYTIERAFALNGFQAFLWGTGGYTSVDNIKVVDDYTYEVNLDSPNGLIALINCHSWTGFIDSTACKEHCTADDPYGTQWVSRNNCGFSPYKLEEWVAGEYMLWTAREDWWAGKPSIDTILIREIPESSNRVAMLEAGAIDMALNLDPEELNYLKGKDGIDVWNILTANSTWIFLDCEDEIFDDVKVRQAMMYALPADEITEDIYKGYGSPMHSMVPAMIPGSSSYWPYFYDLEKAKSLLAEAGYPEGFTCEMAYDNGNPMDEAICVAYQAALAKIGVTANLKSTMMATLTEQKYSKSLQICMETGLPVQPDINFGCRLYFEPGGSNNFGKYSNDTVMAMMLEGAQILDNDERIAYHEGLQKILVDEVCSVPVCSTNLQIAKRDNINGKLVYDTVNDFYWDTLEKN